MPRRTVHRMRGRAASQCPAGGVGIEPAAALRRRPRMRNRTHKSMRTARSSTPIRTVLQCSTASPLCLGCTARGAERSRQPEPARLARPLQPIASMSVRLSFERSRPFLVAPGNASRRALTVTSPATSTNLLAKLRKYVHYRCNGPFSDVSRSEAKSCEQSHRSRRHPHIEYVSSSCGGRCHPQLTAIPARSGSR